MKIVYGTFDNEGESCYLYNGEWFPFGDDELLYSEAEYTSKNRGWALYGDEVLERGLNNPEFLVRFEVEE